MERRDLVDREELRRRINEDPFPVPEVWEMHLDDMPAVECPRGWTRDEVLAELDKHPDAVCERQSFTGGWNGLARWAIGCWHPEVRRYDVRVVRVAPEPEWVPWWKSEGRVVIAPNGVECRVDELRIFGGTPQGRGEGITPWGDLPVNADGQVAVRPKAAN